MANIYNITTELEDIFLELEENGGELTPELEEHLAITQENFKSKLDSYRKAYTMFNLEAESCKKEEQRLAVLRKTKENNAERLKGVMLDAVIAYGDLGKSGNKVINLVDSKLYTKNSKCVEIDENLNQIFIDLVLEHLQSLWDNDMIDSNFSFSIDVLLEQINDKFTERYPEQSARLREETGSYFTLDDLDCIKVKFEIEKTVGDLANKINFDLLNTFFNHQHEMTRSSSINKTTMKNILNDGKDISIAKLVENTSLIIK
jgi:predicted transcriptional regulator